MTTQQVILVNESDEQVGTMDKMEAHVQGLLHRAFSVFIFNNKGEMLLQQRADEKYHTPGLWTNACCSHPFPDEDVADAAERRLREELGVEADLEELFSFTYRTQFDNKLIEHEFDHVFAGIYDGEISPDKNEVKNFGYGSIQTINNDLKRNPDQYTPWFRIVFPKMQEWAENKFGTAIAQPLVK